MEENNYVTSLLEASRFSFTHNILNTIAMFIICSIIGDKWKKLLIEN